MAFYNLNIPGDYSDYDILEEDKEPNIKHQCMSLKWVAKLNGYPLLTVRQK